MKKFVVIVLLMFFFITKMFGQKCVIYGTTANQLSYKYAYLYDSDSKTFVTSPIIKHKFTFNLDKPEKLKVLILSFNTELFKSYKEVLESPDYKYSNRGRLIALEDTLKVTLKEYQYPQDAIVEGKILNKAIDEMNHAIKSRNYGQFFEKYPDSPIAIVFLRTLAKYSMNSIPLFSIHERKLAYDKLSDRLKNSDEGKELWEIITK